MALELSPDAPIRRPTASCDPDVLATYERLVVAREGLQTFLRATLFDQTDWAPRISRAAHLVNEAQKLIEGLR